jgi:hypothetical protein
MRRHIGARSVGVLHPEQPFVEASFEGKQRGNACVFPTSQQVGYIASFLDSPATTQLVSIGCGEAWVEGLLQQRGVDVTCVDLVMDPPVAAPRHCRGAIRRITQYEIFEIERPQNTALLFCFGRRVPLEAYVEAYPDLRTVLIIGDCGGVAEPAASAMEQWPGWEVKLSISVRGRCGSTRCVAYQREAAAVVVAVAESFDENHAVMSMDEIDAL